MATIRSTSRVTYSTVFMRSTSVFRRTHGACSAKYALVSPRPPQIASRARLNSCFSNAARAASSRPLARASSALSSAVKAPGTGTRPSQFLATMDNERCARFPKLLARSEFIRPTMASWL
ncbi:hypothetical protein FQZ97_941460 [compost metagenome]